MRDLPGELGEIVTRAMARDPARRFASADAMRGALLAWLDGAGAPPVAASPAVVTPQPVVAASDTPVDVAPVPVRRAPIQPPPRRQRRPVAAWPLGLLLVALAGGYLGASLLIDRDPTDLPGIVVGSAGGGVFPDPTPSPTLTPTPTTAPPSPSPSATVAPTSTPVPGPADTPSPPATDAPIAVAGPADAVAAFYSYVESGRFDNAYAMWSDRMKAAYPRQDNLDDRFGQTADVTFDALYVAEQSPAAATVQANFTETYDSGATRGFIGYWRLVRVDGRWLLDEPTY